MPEYWTRKYLKSQNRDGEILNSVKKAGNYILPRFVGSKYEEVYLVLLDSRNKALACEKLGEGNVNMAEVNSRKVIETVLKHNAAGVILAHNHLSGVALPSPDDHLTTQKLRSALTIVGVNLYDHIIVAGEDFVSFRDSGLLEK